jgi:hypothetical protein
MRMKFWLALGLMWALAVPIAAQAQQRYLEVTMLKIEPGKRADFEAIGKRVADANRRYQGDHWIAMEAYYGEGDIINMISTRSSYAEIETASKAFHDALDKGYPGGYQKFDSDVDNTVVSLRSEVRRRLPRLSYNAPADAAATDSLIGQSRWIRTITVRVRPGQERNFETIIRQVNDSAQRSNQPATLLVSEADSGARGTVFYISRPLKGLADLDGGISLARMLGDAGYESFLQGIGNTTENIETAIYRFVPALSNPPDDVVSAGNSFWSGGQN